ncbi:MAG: hypothetical protein RIF32_15295 [Leptospirales bacterium]|jgi:hypothetical protein
MKKQDGILFGVVLFLAIGVTPVHAYLDPGTGSFILQMVLGGVAGAALLIKVYWQKFLGFFASRSAGEFEKSPNARESSGE